MNELVMMDCAALKLRLSTNGCARFFQDAQRRQPDASDSKFACRFCPIGAKNAGVDLAPMGEATNELKLMCPRCERPASRWAVADRPTSTPENGSIHPRLCVSCYNRAREARLGRNAKGTRPRLTDQLHAEALTVSEAGHVAVRTAPRVTSRVEAILAASRQATTPMTFGTPPLDVLGMMHA